MTRSITVAGIDTAKAKLDIARLGRSEVWQVENAHPGWQRLGVQLLEAHIVRVGIEATGGYEKGVVAYLRTLGFEVMVLQPIQVKAHARKHKHRAKNDKIDAQLIAECAADLAMPDIAPDPRLEALAPALTYLEQIEDDITRLKVRLEHAPDRRVIRTINADIARLKARAKSEMARILGGLRAHADLARRFELVESVDGIGARTALAIVVRMPELGRISREQAAALAGLAPFDDDSGKRKGQRYIAGGRERLRRSLYAAALPASFRWNSALMDLYQRLTARNKPHRLALVACARKLLIFANAVVQHDRPWEPNLAA